MSAEAEAIVTTAAADATTSPTTIKKVAAVDADTTPDKAVPVATDGASEGNGKVEQERAEKILKGKELFSQGSRNFLVKSYDEAADELSQVCQLYEEVYGELADELGQPLLLYAKALIAMALDENKVIDVPDEAADDDDEDMDDDEEAGDEADKAGEAKKEGGEAKEAGEKEKKEEAAPSKKESNGASSTNGKALENIKEETDEADSTVDAATDEKNAKKASTGVEEVSSSNGGASVNDDERPSTSNGEAAASPSNGAAAVAGVEDEEEIEEGVSGSLQLAWEILEAAAKIFLRQGLNGLPYLAEVQTELANIEFENGILEAAREDYEKALLILSDLPTKNRRALAELHYKIGLTFLMAQQNKEGAASLRLSSALIEEEITEIKGKEEPLSEREKNNMLDLEETKQEILAKIQEIEEMQAQTIAEVRAALDSYIKPMGSGSSSSGGGGNNDAAASSSTNGAASSPSSSSSSSAAAVTSGAVAATSSSSTISSSSTAKPTDITHLIKRKKPEEPGSEAEALCSPAKRPAL
ncbi:protein NASP homolog [Drosophila guanche]|uniref:Blast:Protein NASP homolog n=1 Tax=Drosophila guanche TaxID=7266 RepID=A0A3B0JP74_DROGU|nr:protein NASP homolog [Drosophila guanche]SPP84034.1 blast:Protein NASP homolog [Drosophila guanche]